MEYTHPYSKHVSRSLYFQGIKKFPKVYGYVYQKTRRMNTISKMMKKIFSTGMGRMLKLIEEVQPAVVVSTFPLAAAVMSKLKSLGLTDIPAITTKVLMLEFEVELFHIKLGQLEHGHLHNFL
jgi:processive 1,2-diacylglycerol beta-glucosyltransferase